MGCTRHTVRKPLICRRCERSNMTRRHKCAIRSGRLCPYVKKTCICCCVVRSGKLRHCSGGLIILILLLLRIAIGRVLLRANSFCSQLGGPSFEHSPFARNWTRLPLSISFLLVIGRAFLPAFLFCSQLDASSFEHFPLACNSWHPIAFFSVRNKLRFQPEN